MSEGKEAGWGGALGIADLGKKAATGIYDTSCIFEASLVDIFEASLVFKHKHAITTKKHTPPRPYTLNPKPRNRYTQSPKT